MSTSPTLSGSSSAPPRDLDGERLVEGAAVAEAGLRVDPGEPACHLGAALQAEPLAPRVEEVGDQDRAQRDQDQRLGDHVADHPAARPLVGERQREREQQHAEVDDARRGGCTAPAAIQSTNRSS